MGIFLSFQTYIVVVYKKPVPDWVGEEECHHLIVGVTYSYINICSSLGLQLGRGPRRELHDFLILLHVWELVQVVDQLLAEVRLHQVSRVLEEVRDVCNKSGAHVDEVLK